MADGLNKVMLIGNLGTEPEMRYTANGSAVTSFRMAVSRSSGSGEERQEHTEWITVTSWNKLAELVGQHIQKGRKVYVEGRLQSRSWEGPDGTKRYATEVVATSILFLDRAPSASREVEDDWPLDPDDIPFDS